MNQTDPDPKDRRTPDEPSSAVPAVPEKPDACLPGEADAPDTYQQALDEALAETFPASDPISPSAAAAGDTPVPSPRDPVDWPLAGQEATKGGVLKRQKEKATKAKGQKAKGQKARSA
jgi:hypothetical protein